MSAPTVVRWAIKYVRPWGEYLDDTTIRARRTDAWRQFHADWSNAPARARTMRRKREVRAVRVEIREIDP